MSNTSVDDEHRFHDEFIDSPGFKSILGPEEREWNSLEDYVTAFILSQCLKGGQYHHSNNENEGFTPTWRQLVGPWTVDKMKVKFAVGHFPFI